MKKLTVEDLLEIAKEVKRELKSGNISKKSEIYISLEVCKDGDESTYLNRVHGGEVIEVGVTQTFSGESYVHIQLNGEPNFNIYSQGETK